MGRGLRLPKWVQRSESRTIKPRRSILGSSPYKRRLGCEMLEDRLLLSGSDNHAPVVALGAATHLVVIEQPPMSISAGASFGLVIAAEDDSGQVDDTFADSVTVGDWRQPLGGTKTVTAQDGTTKNYSVSVSASANQKNVALFSINGVDACATGCAGTLVTGGGTASGTIALQLPSGTSLTSLTPTIALTSGAVVSPASGAALDFTNPVTYAVTNAAATTATPKNWVVTVTVGP